jgi:hypothetical protein
VCLDRVFGNEKLRGDLAIAEAAGDQGENFELACRDAEGLLAGRIESEGFEGGGFRGDKHFLHHDRFADGFATARDAEAEPDAEGREEDGDERAVELNGVLDDDEAVFGVLECGDEEAADETKDDDVALHDGVVEKYNRDGEEVVLPARKQKGRGEMPFKERDSIHDTCANGVLGGVKMRFCASGNPSLAGLWKGCLSPAQDAQLPAD